MKVKSMARAAGATSVAAVLAAGALTAPAHAADRVQIARLTPTSASATLFGQAVAVSGNTIVVAEGSGFSGPGPVHVYERRGTAVTKVAELTTTDTSGTSQFGLSVAVSDDAIVVGDPGTDSGRGAAYVFSKPVGGWANATATVKLAASDGIDGDGFGYSVAMSGDTLLAGAPYSTGGAGTAYAFVKPADGWTADTETAKLTASGGGTTDSLGWSVGLDGDTAVVSAPFAQANGNLGAAYVFEKPDGGWASGTQEATLTASGTLGLGNAVAVSGDTVVATDSEAGKSYVYAKPAGGWATTSRQNAILTGGAQGDKFGQSVAASGDTVMVGAPMTNAFEGAVYRFEKPSAGWADATGSAPLTASPASPQGFGVPIAISGYTTVVGAGYADNYKGAAYVFDSEPEPTPPPPPNPTGKKVQKPANAKGKPPKSIKKSGLTVLTGRNARTNAGQLIRTRVRVNSSLAQGEVRYFRVIRGPLGKTSIRTYGYSRLKVVVMQSAPPTSKYKAFVKRTVYVNGKKA